MRFGASDAVKGTDRMGVLGGCAFPSVGGAVVIIDGGSGLRVGVGGGFRTRAFIPRAESEAFLRRDRRNRGALFGLGVLLASCAGGARWPCKVGVRGRVSWWGRGGCREICSLDRECASALTASKLCRL